jgi:hypothetical protein
MQSGKSLYCFYNIFLPLLGYHQVKTIVHAHKLHWPMFTYSSIIICAFLLIGALNGGMAFVVQFPFA